MTDKMCTRHEQIQKDIVALFKMSIPVWISRLIICSVMGIAIYGVRTYVTKEEYNKDMASIRMSLNIISKDVKDLIKAGAK